MKVKTGQTVYYCDHCKKKHLRKKAMEKHEKWCASNPDNRRACEGCMHLAETTIEVYYGNDPYGGEKMREAKAFKCMKLGKMLYPLKVEERGLVDRYPETFEEQEPMPKECEHMEYPF